MSFVLDQRRIWFIHYISAKSCHFLLSSPTGFQCVGSGLSLEPPATTEADEEEDGMSDIIQEVLITLSTVWFEMTTRCLDLLNNDGGPQVTGLIWSQDLRVQEVRRLLQSSRPVRVSVVQLPEVSDHEYIEEKENK